MALKYLVLLLMVTSLLACKQQVIDDDYPPAQISITGAQHTLTIPNSNPVNYQIDEATNQLVITLGIARSGLESTDSFSVGISPAQDTIASLIESGTLKRTIPMTAEMFSFPETVIVEQGNTGAEFQVTIAIDRIASANQALAFGVRLNSPSKYQLNDKLSTMIIVLDYRKISGNLHPGDQPAEGRIFETFSRPEDIATWTTQYNLVTEFIAPDKVRITQSTNDYWSALRKGITYTSSYPILAIRVYETPTSGTWLLKGYDGLIDMAARPGVAETMTMPDGSTIYYWDMTQLTDLPGTFQGDIQVVTESATNQSLTFSWVKSFTDKQSITAYYEEEL